MLGSQAVCSQGDVVCVCACGRSACVWVHGDSPPPRPPELSARDAAALPLARRNNVVLLSCRGEASEPSPSLPVLVGGRRVEGSRGFEPSEAKGKRARSGCVGSAAAAAAAATTNNNRRGAEGLSKKETYGRMKEMVGGCCVCSDERGWAENPLVYCDGHGCNVAVHQGKESQHPPPQHLAPAAPSPAPPAKRLLALELLGLCQQRCGHLNGGGGVVVVATGHIPLPPPSPRRTLASWGGGHNIKIK